MGILTHSMDRPGRMVTTYRTYHPHSGELELNAPPGEGRGKLRAASYAEYTIQDGRPTTQVHEGSQARLPVIIEIAVLRPNTQVKVADPVFPHRYEKPEDWSIVEVPLPKIRPDDVLVKVKACGVCGTDLHIHEGEFIAKFPLIPGHETIGVVVDMAPDVKGFKVGDRVAADNSELCGHCFYCRRGEALLCEDFSAHGVLNLDGGFAEYANYPQGKLFKIHNLSDIDATLIEPASCAMHGLEKIAPKPGSHALLIGAGPTGLMMAQFLKNSGVSQLTIAAPEGSKLDLAKSLDAADTYIGLSRKDSTPQWEQLKKDNPYGFDIVVEASGSSKVLEDAINYVRRGGKLVCYGVYPSSARVSWAPSKIFGDEITIIGSFSETFMFPATVDYLDSGKVKTKGIVNKTFKLEQWGEALESIRNKSAIKAAIVFD
ncbi:putative NADP-dependent mannitol dehydrogenase [Seiridium cardinale]|uniref:NADP-dependent mannitol dehydrogenase n=1 Tax=Seiridium cardinale TaxID=138064 RepID=A0ABR2Y4Q3_9PEZI